MHTPIPYTHIPQYTYTYIHLHTYTYTHTPIPYTPIIAGEEVLSRSEASEFRDVANKRSNRMLDKMMAEYKNRIPEEAFPNKFKPSR